MKHVRLKRQILAYIDDYVTLEVEDDADPEDVARQASIGWPEDVGEIIECEIDAENYSLYEGFEWEVVE